MEFQYIPRMSLPRHEHGVDWDKDRPCFIRKYTTGNLEWELFWIPGKMCWGGRGLQKYSPPSLRFKPAGHRYLGTEIDLPYKARLSAKLFKEPKVAEQINELAGMDAASMILRDKTLILTE